MLAEGQVAAARRQEYLLNKRLLHLYGPMNLGEEEREGRGEEEKGTPPYTPPKGGLHMEVLGAGMQTCV